MGPSTTRNSTRPEARSTNISRTVPNLAPSRPTTGRPCTSALFVRPLVIELAPQETAATAGPAPSVHHNAGWTTWSPAGRRTPGRLGAAVLEVGRVGAPLLDNLIGGIGGGVLVEGCPAASAIGGAALRRIDTLGLGERRLGLAIPRVVDLGADQSAAAPDAFGIDVGV